MSSSLRRFASHSRQAFRSNAAPFSRLLSTDSLVEIYPGEIGRVSGIPEEHLRRRVVIYSPARTATQQGSGKVGRWENPLMGWTSTGDPYANVGDAALSFDSEEAAKEFAEKHGWEYTVKKRQTPLLKAPLIAISVSLVVVVDGPKNRKLSEASVALQCFWLLDD
ncbi:unnamed protein product [Ilex paraguariensis]|uniref:NADH dehydrogenase [ubiquinone] iron-sulfur protein 4, mitochondrial n=1 Tax=Ilex paraguariensis TaxID=185542 RepID=A0ABC8SWL3_9AQUA